VVSIGDRFFDVQTGNGVLRVVAVKPEGRKSMTSREFLNGSVLAEGYTFNE
jgi:methionyl-tRNA formyltransferase